MADLTEKCKHGEERRYVCKLCEGDIAAFEAALAESTKECADAEAEWARVDEEAKTLRARVAELERTEGIAAGMLDEATAMLESERARADAAENRAAESAGALDLLDLYESRRREAESRAIAAEQRMERLEGALKGALEMLSNLAPPRPHEGSCGSHRACDGECAEQVYFWENFNELRAALASSDVAISGCPGADSGNVDACASCALDCSRKRAEASHG